MELEAYKAELAREILMSNSRQLLDKVKMVLHGESSVNINTVKEDCVPYTPRTKSEVLDDLKEACEEARLIREGKAKVFQPKIYSMNCNIIATSFLREN